MRYEVKVGTEFNVEEAGQNLNITLSIQGEQSPHSAHKVDWRFWGIISAIFLVCLTLCLVIGFTLLSGDDVFIKLVGALANKIGNSK